MKLCAEISLYPLKDRYIPAIEAFIERLNAYPGLELDTSATSTRVSGEYAALMNVLTKEFRRTFDDTGRSVFVVKFLGGGDGA